MLRRPNRLLSLCGPVTLLFCLCGYPVAPPATAAELPVIKEIRIENVGPGRIDRTFVLAHISSSVGERLDRGKISNDVKALLATGGFSTVRIVAEEAEDGIRLVYRLGGRYRLAAPVVVAIKEDEDSYYSESRIQDWIDLEEGDLVVMEGFLTRKTVNKVKEVLESPERRGKMVATNYDIATRHYSYAVLRRWLNTLLVNFFGVDA